MKTSEMIAECEKIMKLFGDVDMFVVGSDDDVVVTEVFVHTDKHGTGAFIATEEWPDPQPREDDW